MRIQEFDRDHIDPRWEDGRDYQLVCGLDEDINFKERDPKFNVRKSNRFLPWRWSREEIGVVPVEVGDLCWFLVGADIESNQPGEWVLMEYLSEEYFAQSEFTTGARNWYINNPEEAQEVGARVGNMLQEWKANNPEIVRQNSVNNLQSALVGLKEWRKDNPKEVMKIVDKMQVGLKQWIQDNPEKVRNQRREAALVNAKRRYRCLITGYESTAAHVTLWQKRRGIDPSPENRIRIL